MIAPAKLPLRYRLFNVRWGAPSGRLTRKALPRRLRLTRLGALLSGCFAYQVNNTTRVFEYPWVFETLGIRPGLRVLEIGGSLAGLQFVLDKAGCDVVNVDPGDELFVGDWAPTPQAFQLLNEALGTDVCLVNGYLEDAKFPDESFDRVISVSVFEHIAEPALATILAEIRRVLKPGGLAVMTVDLFLDVQPFAPAASNAYGHNVSVKWIVETSGLDLVGGRRAELYGYEEFDWRAVPPLVDGDGVHCLRGVVSNFPQGDLPRQGGGH